MNYDPGTGRFLSEDPRGNRGGDENLYRYVRNMPLILNDPSGETPPHVPWYYTYVPDVRKLTHDPPKDIAARINSLLEIGRQADLLDAEAQKLLNCKDPNSLKRLREIDQQKNQLLEKIWDEINIFNDLKLSNPNRFV